MKSFRFFALAAGLVVPAHRAFAQDLAASAELQTITALADTIRWEGILASIVLIGVAWVLLRIADNLISGLGEVFAERRLVFQKVSAFFRFAVYLSTIVAVVMLSFRISREILAIIGGTVAVATGFALKDLAASIISGIMIIFDRPFQLGDRVEFGGEYGDVTAIGLRSVKLQTLDDSVVTIPNNRLMTDVTKCGNYGVLDMQVVVDFHIGLDQDVELARELVREAAVVSNYVHLPKPVEVLVSQLLVENYLAVRLRLKVYVLDTRYEKALESDVTMRVLKAFSKHDIQPPAVIHRQTPG